MLLATLALPLLIGAGVVHTDGELPSWAVPSPPAAMLVWFRATPPADPGSPWCHRGQCLPRIAIPGRDPVPDAKAQRTDLALAAVDRLQIGAVSSIARLATTTGMRVDFVPRKLDASVAGRGRGFGRIGFGLRWRLDAWHGPSWLAANER